MARAKRSADKTPMNVIASSSCLPLVPQLIVLAAVLESLAFGASSFALGSSFTSTSPPRREEIDSRSGGARSIGLRPEPTPWRSAAIEGRARGRRCAPPQACDHEECAVSARDGADVSELASVRAPAHDFSSVAGWRAVSAAVRQGHALDVPHTRSMYCPHWRSAHVEEAPPSPPTQSASVLQRHG